MNVGRHWRKRLRLSKAQGPLDKGLLTNDPQSPRLLHLLEGELFNAPHATMRTPRTPDSVKTVGEPSLLPVCRPPRLLALRLGRPHRLCRWQRLLSLIQTPSYRWI